jgi:hypothetical protein
MITSGTDEVKFISSQELSEFTGTMGYHKVSFFPRAPLATDGVKFVLEKGSCYWLFDIITSYQPKILREHPEVFSRQFWYLVDSQKPNHAMVVCEDGNGNEVLSQEIPSTDFVFDFLENRKLSIWVHDSIAMLPSEY